MRGCILSFDQLRNHNWLGSSNEIIKSRVFIKSLKLERGLSLNLLFNILEYEFFIPCGVFTSSNFHRSPKFNGIVVEFNEGVLFAPAVEVLDERCSDDFQFELTEGIIGLERDIPVLTLLFWLYFRFQIKSSSHLLLKSILCILLGFSINVF